MSDNRVMIDTSVWIAYFKGEDQRLADKVDDTLSSSEVCVPRVVIAELVQGAKTEKEIAVIEGFVEAFSIVDQTDSTWLKAGKLSFSMKRKGITVHLIDCYIAILARENNCKIFSLDEHFREIRRVEKIELL